jgi:RNA polymerase sigma-70 factor, ECF subfamily
MTSTSLNHSIPKPREQPGDEASTTFTSVYEQHSLSVYRYILSRVGNPEDAHDLTAIVFLKAYKRFSSFRGDASVISWLIGIARNQISDHYRGKEPDVALDAIPELPAKGASPEDSIVQRAELKRVSEALNALSDDRREALSLRLFASLSNPEIADAMERSTESVAMLISRGLSDLRQRLETTNDAE